MTNYDNYEEWKEVNFKTVTLEDNQEFSLEAIHKLTLDLIVEAQRSGLQNCHLRFRSVMEPYENYAGSPEVSVWGYRPLNKEEEYKLAYQQKIEKLSKELGISVYHTRQYLDLQKMGVIN